MSGTEVAAGSGSNDVRPFEVAFPDAELSDLRRRINATRLPEREAVADDAQGVPLALMKELARYWETGYDWAAVRGEAERLAAVHHGDRRARHPLHPCPLPTRGRTAADRHARVAGLDRRATEDHQAAH